MTGADVNALSKSNDPPMIKAFQQKAPLGSALIRFLARNGACLNMPYPPCSRSILADVMYPYANPDRFDDAPLAQCIVLLQEGAEADAIVCATRSVKCCFHWIAIHIFVRHCLIQRAKLVLSFTCSLKIGESNVSWMPPSLQAGKSCGYCDPCPQCRLVEDVDCR